MDESIIFNEKIDNITKYLFIGIFSILFGIVYLILTLTKFILKFWPLAQSIFVIILLILIGLYSLFIYINWINYELYFYNEKAIIKTLFKTIEIEYNKIKKVDTNIYNKFSKYYIIKINYENKIIKFTTKNKDKVLSIITKENNL